MGGKRTPLTLENGSDERSGLLLVQRQIGLAINCGVLLLLSSCGTPPVAFADHCASLGRSLSKDERFTAALLYAYPKAELHSLRQFVAFRDEYIGAHKGASKLEVVRAFLRRYPNCCEAVKPWPVRDYHTGPGYSLGRNESAERVFADYTEDFRWSHDILVGVKGAPDLSNRLTFVDFEQSDCGRTGSNSHG